MRLSGVSYSAVVPKKVQMSQNHRRTCITHFTVVRWTGAVPISPQASRVFSSMRHGSLCTLDFLQDGVLKTFGHRERRTMAPRSKN